MGEGSVLPEKKRMSFNSKAKRNRESIYLPSFHNEETEASEARWLVPVHTDSESRLEPRHASWFFL